jgi:chitin synthase
MIVESVFDYFYIALVIMTLIISLTTTVDRGISIFIFLMCLFGFLLLCTMGGIIMYLIKTGFYPEVMYYQTKEWPFWRGTGEHNFSILVLSGVIMCIVFLIPMILRPLDFLLNVRTYLIGLLSYLFMMPTFINIMQIYAMCNLHDISWGNRPTTQGVEAVTLNA